uniref:Uncharacterized protein n=1 Tax=Caenorhabditis japonica TaxID=281687 RepID=A0A8R1ETH5_CAEJA
MSLGFSWLRRRFSYCEDKPFIECAHDHEPSVKLQVAAQQLPISCSGQIYQMWQVTYLRLQDSFPCCLHFPVMSQFNSCPSAAH